MCVKREKTPLRAGNSPPLLAVRGGGLTALRPRILCYSHVPVPPSKNVAIIGADVVLLSNIEAKQGLVPPPIDARAKFPALQLRLPLWGRMDSRDEFQNGGVVGWVSERKKSGNGDGGGGEMG